MTAQAVFKNEPGGLYESLYTAEAKLWRRRRMTLSLYFWSAVGLFIAIVVVCPKALVEQTTELDARESTQQSLA